MGRSKYSDDEDYYSQDFEKSGVLSIWLGMTDRSLDKDVDTLQDLCGVGYYELSEQESNSYNYELVDLKHLFADISYAQSFLDEVVLAARERNIKKARRVTVQYNFEYDPTKVTREIAADPIFLGVFSYSLK
ncbi:hypothetical protein ACO0LC_28615 [Undibacterium sp. JH2W]|uniref:hypothetical protein n=1 Tax=Undibacterium sp. JH2W TaxID=3413037 RepID=UPI003BF2843C